MIFIVLFGIKFEKHLWIQWRQIKCVFDIAFCSHFNPIKTGTIEANEMICFMMTHIDDNVIICVQIRNFAVKILILIMINFALVAIISLKSRDKSYRSILIIKFKKCNEQTMKNFIKLFPNLWKFQLLFLNLQKK